MQFGRQNRWSTFWHGKPMIAFLCVLVVLLAVSVYKRYVVERSVSVRKDEVMVELERLKAREHELHERVLYLEGERGVEEEIRKNFDVALPGEQVVILTGETAVPGKPDKESAPEAPWYLFWR